MATDVANIEQLIAQVVKQLVHLPEKVQVVAEQEGDRTIYKISVEESDLGRIIGKNGQVIRVVRSLATLLSPEGYEITVDVIRA